MSEAVLPPPPGNYKDVEGTAYQYDAALIPELEAISDRVQQMRAVGSLTPDSLRHLRKFFRLKNIYHSNAIEGNRLDFGETRLVVEQGLTITGKPLKDSIEAKNLSHALDFFESLATSDLPFSAVELRQIHTLILKGIDDENAGRYRTTQVEVSGSAFSPPPHESVPPQMTELCDWLASVSTNESRPNHPILLAAAAHAWFVRIHPFVDGNGRTARIILNLILMRYGYPIAVITKDDRQRYYDALEESQASDLTPFVALVIESVTESLEEYERAASEESARVEWADSLVAKFTGPQKVEAANFYELWKASMELLKSYFIQSAYLINEKATGLARIYVKDFGALEFEKYLSLRDKRSTSRTWFFRVDFRSEDIAARYLFFFGSPSTPMSPHLRGGDRVTLHVATEITPYRYERLENLTRGDLPDLREVAWKSSDEQFLARFASNHVAPTLIERLVQDFFDQVVRRNFPS